MQLNLKVNNHIFSLVNSVNSVKYVLNDAPQSAKLVCVRQYLNMQIYYGILQIRSQYKKLKQCKTLLPDLSKTFKDDMASRMVG